MKNIRVLIGSLTAVAVLFVAGLMFIPQADAQVTRDCSPDAAITCGVTSISELRQKYNSDTTKGTQTIYSYMGISSNTVNKATYKEGTVTKSGLIIVDGKTVATNAVQAGRHPAWPGYPASTKHVVNGLTFYTRTTQNSHMPASQTAIVFFSSNGTFIGAVIHDCGNPVTGKPTPPPVPPKPPVYACNALKATEVNRNTFTFTTSASASNGAVIKDYTYSFGDGSSTTTGASTSHTYAKDGTYKVVAKVNVVVNGKTVVAPGTCEVQVTVKPTPKAPVYACNALKATAVSRDTFNFVTDATATNGAVIKDYTYSFGDGSSTTTGASTSHTYGKAGTYKIVAKVNVVVDGKTVVAPGTCEAQVTVKPADSPSVNISKTVNGKEYEEVTVNEQFQYEVVVTNTGNTTLNNLKVTDPAPKGITMLSADFGTIENNVWSYTIPSLDTGKSFTVKIQAKYPAYESGTQVNEACVDTASITPEHPTLCDTASTSTPPPVTPPEVPPVTPPETPPTPTELPHTGIGANLGSLLGAGSLTGVALAYVASRRKL